MQWSCHIFYLIAQKVFHSEFVAWEEIYSYVLWHQYYIERILEKIIGWREKPGKRIVSLKESFGFVFLPPHQFSKHFALFMLIDCRGDSTNVIAQTAPMAHQPCESMQKGRELNQTLPCVLGQLMPQHPHLGCRNCGSHLHLTTNFLHDLQCKTYRWKAEVLLTPNRVAGGVSMFRDT